MAIYKPSIEERQSEAEKQYKLDTKDKKDICKLLSLALKKGNIQGHVLVKNPNEIDFDKISSEYETNNASDIIFIQFTENGHIAVVGAGKDLAFSKNKSRGTWRVISTIKGIEWDTETVIVIPVQNIKNCRIVTGENLLEYRNGVEQYLGDYLISNNVPILNYYQHKNYSDGFWDKCKGKNYIIC